MKVILNEDVKHLGEEGDVKEVANGYARNYLLPRGLAMPYTKEAVAYFESIRDQIEARKAEKRENAKSLKERIEALTVTIAVSAGPNGKLYGSVTAQTLADELAKQGFDIERKRIEVPGSTIKTAGKFEVSVKLYENAVAKLPVVVEAKLPEVEAKASGKKPRAKKEEAAENTAEASTEATPENPAPAENEAVEMEN
ncbi:MAG: 50S ribosomal protein L9 [Treponemataceae bacterium]